MRFARNARIFRGTLDAAPFASVFFLLVIFVMLGTVVYTPGVHIQLPVADNLPGTDKPTVAVAVDANNRLFYANHLISESELKQRLATAVKESTEPPTLVVQADEAVAHGYLTHLALLARDAGIREALYATLPRLIAAPGGAATKP
jgi:biopolymer transport protein ExbD